MTVSRAKRTDLIVEVFKDAFDPLMRADPVAFRTKYRKMAADPHAFYRGSACLYYADVTSGKDEWVDEQSDDDDRDRAPAKPCANAWPTHRHVHTRAEHQHREADIGEERSRRVARVEPARPGSPDDHAGGELADHNGNVAAASRGREWAEEPREDDEREDAEAHVPSLDSRRAASKRRRVDGRVRAVARHEAAGRRG